MNYLTINFIHALLATILALTPLSVAAYLDLRQKSEAEQKSR
jgi:hypothetical protein